MSDKISVSKKALRRFFRKYDAKCRQLDACQQELRRASFCERLVNEAIAMFFFGFRERHIEQLKQTEAQP